jgi:hypothetical protein
MPNYKGPTPYMATDMENQNAAISADPESMKKSAAIAANLPQSKRVSPGYSPAKLMLRPIQKSFVPSVVKAARKAKSINPKKAYGE